MSFTSTGCPSLAQNAKPLRPAHSGRVAPGTPKWTDMPLPIDPYPLLMGTGALILLGGGDHGNPADIVAAITPT
jgi:hypothetical protein